MVWWLIAADRGTQTLTGCPRLRGVVRMTTLDLEPIKERLPDIPGAITGIPLQGTFDELA